MKRICGATLAIVLGWSIAATPILAGDDEPKEPKEPAKAEENRKSDEKVPVYTNDDLARLYGDDSEEEKTESETAETAEQPAADEAAKKPSKDKSKAGDDPLKWLEERKKGQAEKEKRVAEAEQAVEAARRKVANLETQLLATRNPFSKRPDLSDEEKETRRNSTESAAERNERTQKMLEEARAEVDAAEENLRQVRSEPVTRGD